MSRNSTVAGTVRSVSRTPDGPVLILDTGRRVPFAGVDEMREPAPPATPTTPPPDSPTPPEAPGDPDHTDDDEDAD